MKKWSKRTKIIIACVLVVVLCTGLGLGLYFGLRSPSRIRSGDYTLRNIRINGYSVNIDKIEDSIEPLIRHVWRPAQGQQLAPQLVELEVEDFPLGRILVPMVDTILGTQTFSGTPEVRVRAFVNHVLPMAITQHPAFVVRISELLDADTAGYATEIAALNTAIIAFAQYLEDETNVTIDASTVTSVATLMTALGTATHANTVWAAHSAELAKDTDLIDMLYDFLIDEVAYMIFENHVDARDNTIELFNAIIDVDLMAVLSLMEPLMGMDLGELLDNMIEAITSLSIGVDRRGFSIIGIGTAVDIITDMIAELPAFITPALLDALVGTMLGDLEHRVENGSVQLLLDGGSFVDSQFVTTWINTLIGSNIDVVVNNQVVGLTLARLLDVVNISMDYNRSNNSLLLTVSLNVEEIAIFFGDNNVPIDFDIVLEAEFVRA